MKNWFKTIDPDNFAKTQGWYVKQIDDYLNKTAPSKPSKTYFGQGRKEILKKIQKGYAVGENELSKVSNKSDQSSIGTTALYNM